MTSSSSTAAAAIARSGITLYSTPTILQPFDGVITHQLPLTATTSGPGRITSQSMSETDHPPPPPPPPPPTSPHHRAITSTIPYNNENYNIINNNTGGVLKYNLSSSSSSSSLPGKSWTAVMPPYLSHTYQHHQHQQQHSGDGMNGINLPTSKKSSSPSSKRAMSWTAAAAEETNRDFKSSSPPQGSPSLLGSPRTRRNSMSHSAKRLLPDKATTSNTSTHDDGQNYSTPHSGCGMCAACQADGVPPGFCMHNTTWRQSHDNTTIQQEQHIFTGNGDNDMILQSRDNHKHHKHHHHRPKIEVFLRAQRAQLEKYLGNADLVEKSFQFVYSMRPSSVIS